MKTIVLVLLAAILGLAAPATALAGTPKYIGSKSCKKCHTGTHKAWKKTKKAKTLEVLAAGQAVEIKKKHKLDPTKDYTQDATCLACHTVGYGQPGGYTIPAAGDAKAAKKAKKLAGIGCESCHGPGSEYREVFKEITDSKRKYKLAELTAKGLITPNKEQCLKCHSDKSPTYDKANPFDFDKAMKQHKAGKIAHPHTELKQREN